jgi:hypothetical protein
LTTDAADSAAPATEMSGDPLRPFGLGANLPWVTYGCDFGANLWHPQGGLAARPDRARLADLFAELSAHGLGLVRWFLFCDGRAGIGFAADGTPLGLDDRVAPDLDTALRLAADARLGIVLTLLDFHWCRPARIVDDVRLGGHGGTIVDPRQRDALLERVFGPVLRAYGTEPAIAGWDLFNEPEWVTLGLGTAHPGTGLDAGVMRRFLAEASALAHAEARQPVTVGSASAAWLGLVRGIGLDVYSPHWYDGLDARWPLDAPVSALGLDRPAWLGEFPTRGSARDIDALLTQARASGYAGALLWSVLASDAASDYATAAPRLAAWCAGAGPGLVSRTVFS